MSFKLYSDVFPAEQPIPVRFTCDGQNLSPKLSWHDTPAGTRSLALIVDDPDAPKGTFTHWLVYNIPPHIHDLPEGTPGTDYLPQGALQGKNDFGDMSYGGPCPPKGAAHHYQFTLYALDIPLTLGAGASVEKLRDAMRGHILGEARMRGTYQRAAGSPTLAAGGAAGRP